MLSTLVWASHLHLDIWIWAEEWPKGIRRWYDTEDSRSRQLDSSCCHSFIFNHAIENSSSVWPQISLETSSRSSLWPSTPLIRVHSQQDRGGRWQAGTQTLIQFWTTTTSMNAGERWNFANYYSFTPIFGSPSRLGYHTARVSISLVATLIPNTSKDYHHNSRSRRITNRNSYKKLSW
jgi:hypothetical protein